MSDAPRICVVIPVYNHGLTVQRVVCGAKAALPVIVVNDGSTDSTPAVLAAEQGCDRRDAAVQPGQGGGVAGGLRPGGGTGVHVMPLPSTRTGSTRPARWRISRRPAGGSRTPSSSACAISRRPAHRLPGGRPMNFPPSGSSSKPACAWPTRSAVIAVTRWRRFGLCG